MSVFSYTMRVKDLPRFYTALASIVTAGRLMM
jgi:hypothetical protein